MSSKVTNIVLSGLGGQGILFIAKTISQAAMSKGLNVVMNEIHGMAQRGGTVITNVRIGDVFSAAVADGTADLIVSTELNETLRVISKAGKHTKTIASEIPIYPLTSFTGFDSYPDSHQVRDEIVRVFPSVNFVNPVEQAERCGYAQVANTALLGAVMAMNILPINSEDVLASMKAKSGHWIWKVNQKAYKMGYDEMKKSLALNKGDQS